MIFCIGVNKIEAQVNKTAVSVVIPVFDEAPNIIAQANEIIDALDNFEGGFEVIFVDDGSKDGTVAEVEKASKNDNRVRLLKMEKNIGQIPAMFKGIKAAVGEVIVTMDGDRQHDPRDIPALVAGVNSGYDLVCGWRKDRKDPYWGKLVPSRIFNILIRILFKVPVHDNSCTLRAYKPEAIKSIELYKYAISFIPVLAKRAGYSLNEMIIRHRERPAGEPKYNSPGRFIYTIKEMIAIYFGKRDHLLPKGR